MISEAGFRNLHVSPLDCPNQPPRAILPAHLKHATERRLGDFRT